MMTFVQVPKRIYYCIFCFYIVSLFVVTATISHQATHIEERVEAHVERSFNTNSVTTGTLLRQLHENQRLLASSYHSSNDEYDKSKCQPRTHTYDKTVSTQAPDIFRVQWTLTTTTTTTTTKISTLTMQFNRTWSPIGVDRMYQLILDHYFDCAVFFRVVPGFIIQFGIASEPEETKKWDVIISDDPMYVQPNLRGTISFATAGSNTRTTQLFINTQDNQEYLDHMGFTPIGIIVINTDDDQNDEDAMDTIVPYIAKPNTKAGEDGIDQGQYMKYGNHWIYQHYPEVDLIVNTTVITTSITTNDNDSTDVAVVEVVVDHEIESSSSSVDSIPIIGRISSPQDDQQTHRFQNRQYNDIEKKNDGNF